MLFLRRTILAPLIASLTIAGVLSFGVYLYLGKTQNLEPQMVVLAGILAMFSFSGFIFYYTVQRPLHKITREMKALLTGKVYRRIMTSKTNELGLLAHFFNEVTRNLENISGSVQSHKRIQKELNTAQEIQQMLIPTKAPPLPGLEVTAKTRPASEIGGDTFDFFKKNDRNLLYIGDSTGHGIPAGIVMVMVDALLETFITIENELSRMVIQLNTFLKPHLRPSMFMTLILLEWIAHEKKLKWVGAGHEYILHVHTSEGTVDAIKAGGLAVGMLADNTKLVKEQEIILKENDFVVLYSDGIVEAKNVNGEVYDLKRLTAFLKSHAAADLATEQLFEAIAIDVGRFMEGQTQLDDMTLIVMKCSVSASTLEKSTEWTAK